MRYFIILLTMLSGFVFADKALIITDIHFTPFNECGSLPFYCSKLHELENEPFQRWSFGGMVANSYKMETNSYFLNDSLKSLGLKFNVESVQNIFITGDLLAHEFSKKFKYYRPFASAKDVSDFEYKTLAYVLYRIHRYFPQSKIYFILGNNDTDLGDYNLPSQKWLNEVALNISAYLPQQYRASLIWQFKRGGYYSLPLNDKLQVIGLNTDVFSKLSIDKMSEDVAQKELNWLGDELESLNRQNKKVIILQHIPLGGDAYKTSKSGVAVFLLKNKFDKKYLNILKKHNTQIVNIYAGHLHSEYWQTVYGIPLIGTLALNELNGNNAGVKLIEYNHDSGEINNFKTYTVNFINGMARWSLLYGFPKDYNTKDSLSTYIENAPSDKKESRVLEYRRVYNGDSQKYPQPIANDKYWPVYFCFSKYVESDNFNNCIKLLKLKLK